MKNVLTKNGSHSQIRDLEGRKMLLIKNGSKGRFRDNFMWLVELKEIRELTKNNFT
jgi:hypothetical protein